MPLSIAATNEQMPLPIAAANGFEQRSLLWLVAIGFIIPSSSPLFCRIPISHHYRRDDGSGSGRHGLLPEL